MGRSPRRWTPTALFRSNTGPARATTAPGTRSSPMATCSIKSRCTTRRHWSTLAGRSSRTAGPPQRIARLRAPGFLMRTREWPNVSQRPTLSIVFQPNNDPGMQPQNVRYATCASIENGGVDGGRGIVSFGCAAPRPTVASYPRTGVGKASSSR